MSDEQIPGQTPQPILPVSTPPPAKKKGLNPLAIVLLLSGAFFIFFTIVSGTLMMRKGSKAKSSAAGLLSTGDGSIGVVEIKGAIMESKKTLKRLEAMDENDDIKGIVLRINSPGGAVAPSQEIYDAVKRFKKPLVVSMSSVAASGGYYIAMGAKKVYASPGTITGSIGVIMQFANIEKLYEWAKVQRFSIKTGKFKDVGAEYRSMTPDEKALLQAMVDDVLKQFKKAVVDGRKLTPAAVDAIADGRIMSGAQAKELKLVDELGGLHEAIDDVAKQAKISGKPNIVYPDRGTKKWWEILMDERRDSEDEGAESAGLVERMLGAGAKDAVTTALSPGVYWMWRGGI